MNADLILANLGDKIAVEHKLALRQKLIDAGDEKANMAVIQTNFVEPWIAVILAFFFGVLGVHRFYLGDVKKGLAFLIGGIGSSILGAVFLMIGALESMVPLLIISILLFVVTGGIGIWAFVDMFLCFKRSKQINFNRLCFSIDMLTGTYNPQAMMK